MKVKSRLTAGITLFIMIAVLFIVLTAGFNPLQAQDNPEDISMEQLETPTELSELIELFHSLEYSVKVHSQGQLTQDSLINYQYEGSETLQGVETEVLSFTMTGVEEQLSSLKVWFDGEEVRQMEVDGEFIPAEMAEMMKDTVLRSVMFPFYNFAEFAAEDLSKLGDVSRSREEIAGEEVDIVRIEIQDRPEYEIDNAVTRLAEFEDFMMVISYDFSSSEQDMEIQFAIESLEFR
ncbi:hypothetical protein [Halarsenatibacter silvermanii]|uniref:Uncharacterized protein n=1 Tax=Halarsenatibacter silvermanii TaxID=321763 RepID=A0A1G9M4F2_9FIRM|nr:hypothetical protein [Halarsenatibacter silvermanii]SDL69078.1 hypothetical protein SAMN04488692_107103 [Halarsenatibacter silvermanii]